MHKAAVLVVDDSPELLGDMKSVAEKASKGYVTAVDNARKAIGLIQESNFDLVITDLRMETEEAGMDVLMAAKDKDWNTQVILVTGFGIPGETGPDAISKGAYDYIDRVESYNYLKRLREVIGPALKAARAGMAESRAA